jgi:hypothetical protein
VAHRWSPQGEGGREEGAAVSRVPSVETRRKRGGSVTIVNMATTLSSMGVMLGTLGGKDEAKSLRGAGWRGTLCLL